MLSKTLGAYLGAAAAVICPDGIGGLRPRDGIPDLRELSPTEDQERRRGGRHAVPKKPTGPDGREKRFRTVVKSNDAKFYR